MECSEFLYAIENYNPQEVTQVERVWMIKHLQECEDCRKVVDNDLKINGVKDDPVLIDLAKLDRKIL